ncbi:alpha/beta hydrolase [Curtobacterium sp. ISL-83]|uniref:alpha/beta hydrolase n=1 Tax=Curtobacterium sp. ISL-83 TaxID=2819145 RepID=UPI001BE9130F|nr:alpha/beta hydrolase [Curtobacterium sp. ISL-83]MBT2501696.1 alpha/beta hydrolase fold domain-containing protein [Curtobacterium sp. ISL-83]
MVTSVSKWRRTMPESGTHEVQQVEVPGPHGRVPLRLYIPSQPAKTALMWVHGGAFIMGDLDVPEANAVGHYLAQHGVTVASVDYRLANEGVHFPVPSDDVLAAWRWITESQDAPARDATWHIGGGSAGGNLAASVTHQVRDGCATVLPASALLLYPVLHDAVPAPSPALAPKLDLVPEEYRFTANKTRELNLNYVGDSSLLQHPYAFPANGDLDGLPPTLIINSEIDYLRPSGEAYGAALALAGNTVTVLHEPGALHGHLNDFDSAPAKRTVERMLQWLGEATV